VIYIVDEDVVQLQALVAVLEFLGYNVKQISNADDAYDILSNAKDVELAMIDVMLGTRGSSNSRFSRTDTQDFLTTGLVLANLLAACGNPIFPKRIAFLSMASSAFLIDSIRERAKSLDVTYYDKREIGRDIMGFGGSIDSLIKSIK